MMDTLEVVRYFIENDTRMYILLYKLISDIAHRIFVHNITR